MNGTYNCIYINQCVINSFCPHVCQRQPQIPYKRKNSSSGVCNDCDKKALCKLTKKIYEVERAQSEYEYTLKDSRIGWNLSSSQAKDIAEIIKLLLENGQSIVHILVTHPEIDCCEKTICNYIEQGAFNSLVSKISISE